MRYWFFANLLFLSAVPLLVQAQPGFFNATPPVPAADSLRQSDVLLDERKQAALTYWSRQTLPDWRGWKRVGPNSQKPAGTAKVQFPHTALAKLARGVDIDTVNKKLREADVYSHVGTHFQLMPGVGHHGDYDFALLGLTAIAHEFWQTGLLATSTKRHLGHTLLNQEGTTPTPKSLWGIIPETENHILMTETARYLKNQLVTEYGAQWKAQNLPNEAYDNQKNGLHKWLTEYLAGIMKNGFDEYNAKPYETYTLSAVQNLYEYAKDNEMVQAAENVLDLHALQFALTSMDLRRVVPFRRQKKHGDLMHAYDKDGGVARYGLLVGNYVTNKTDRKREPKLQPHAWTIPAVGEYQVPDSIQDIMIDKGNVPYLYRSYFGNATVVHAQDEFLISAGGIYHDKYEIPFTGKADGIARPTVIMLDNGTPWIGDMLRFTERVGTYRKNNTCVYRNFACGINPVLPGRILEEASNIITDGNWTFLAVDDVYIGWFEHIKPDASYARSVGFAEVVAKDKFASLTAFQQRVQRFNQEGAFDHFGTNTYTTTDGRKITFRMAEEPRSGLQAALFGPVPSPNLTTWKIRKVETADGDEKSITTALSDWPFMIANSQQSDYVIAYSDGSGKVLFNNPHLGQSLVLDAAGGSHANVQMNRLRSQESVF